MKSKLLLLQQYSYRLNYDQTASIYIEQALQVAESLIDYLDEIGSADEQVGMAVTYNNLSVISLKQANF